MSLDNVIVRPKRRFVEYYANLAAWDHLTIDEQADLTNEVAGLPSGLKDDDVHAKQFDLLILRTQFSVLRHHHTRFAGLKKRIVETARLLELLRNVPMVAAELPLILDLQTDEYWQDITAEMLETVRRRLRDLIKLIEVKRRTIVYSDLKMRSGRVRRSWSQGFPSGLTWIAFVPERGSSCAPT